MHNQTHPPAVAAVADAVSHQRRRNHCRQIALVHASELWTRPMQWITIHAMQCISQVCARLRNDDAAAGCESLVFRIIQNYRQSTLLSPTMSLTSSPVPASTPHGTTQCIMRGVLFMGSRPYTAPQPLTVTGVCAHADVAFSSLPSSQSQKSSFTNATGTRCDSSSHAKYSSEPTTPWSLSPHATATWTTIAINATSDSQLRRRLGRALPLQRPRQAHTRGREHTCEH